MSDTTVNIAIETTANTAGAKATEEAIDAVADKAKGLGTAGAEGGKDLVDALGNAGDKGGANLAKGIAQGVLGADAIGKAWEIGGMIGAKLGEGMTAAWEAGEGSRADAFWASLGSGDAQARIAAEYYAQEMSASVKKLNAEIAEDYRNFWAEYNNTLPKNAGDWLVEIGEKADELSTKLKGLSEVQSALLKLTRTKIQQDHLDKKDEIENNPMLSKSDKMAAHAANDANKIKMEADLRGQDRLNKAKEIGAEVEGKAAEVAALKQAEQKQKERELAERHAKALAQEAIAASEVGGSKATPENKDFFTQQAYDKIKKKTGLDITPQQDEKAALLKAKAELDKAAAEFEKAKTEAARKGRILAVEQMADDEATVRTQNRSQKSNQKAVIEQRQKEWVEEADAKAKEREQRPLPSADVAPKPVSMQDQMNSANEGLKNAARGTTDDAAKMKFGAMSAALMDGKGDTAGEMAAIQQMLSNLGSSRSENQAALRTALQQMEALQKDGSTMQQALSGALDGLVQNQQQLVAYVRSLQGQIEQIRTTVQNQ